MERERYFLMYYSVLSGLHLAHVLAGVLILASVLRAVQVQETSSHTPRGLGGGAVFWHLVDLLWLMLFPLLYLVH
jgi:nitric oxide reductase NorE protein